MITKIKARFVIGYVDNDHTIFENAEVVFKDDTILYVGTNFSKPVDREILAGNAIISPGFIDLNALGDIDHDILHFQANANQADGLIWSHDYAKNHKREVLNFEEKSIVNQYAFSQLIRNGITTAMPITSVLFHKWARTYDEIANAAETAAHLGLRVYLGPSYQSGMRVTDSNGDWKIYWQENEGEAGLKEAVRFVNKYDGSFNGLIKGFLAPERIETITQELLRKSKQLSDDLQCPIRLHAAQGRFEYQEIQKRHQKTPISYLNSIGFLGERTLIPHAIFTSGSKWVGENGNADLDILSSTNTTIIHCPLIMARHGLALDSFDRYKRNNINIAMGTDTFPPDMIENMRVASFIAQLVTEKPDGSLIGDIYRSATLSGAKALQRDDIGRLAPGTKADIIIIDLSDFTVGVIDDPLKTMIYGTSGLNVKTAFINGKVVMWEGKLPNIDLDYLREKAQLCFNKMKKSYSERDYLHRSIDDLFPSSFNKSFTE